MRRKEKKVLRAKILPSGLVIFKNDTLTAILVNDPLYIFEP